MHTLCSILGHLIWFLRGNASRIDCQTRFVSLSDCSEKIQEIWGSRKSVYCFIREDISNDPITDGPYEYLHFVGRFNSVEDLICRIEKMEETFGHNKLTIYESVLYNTLVRSWVEVIIV